MPRFFRPYKSIGDKEFTKRWKEDAQAIIAASDNYDRHLMRTMNDSLRISKAVTSNQVRYSTPKQKPPMLKCNGAHCKCMNLGGSCPNNHYVTCPEHGPKTNPPMRSTEITKENLRVGDVIVYDNGLCVEVLEVLGNSFLASPHIDENNDWLRGYAGAWHTFVEAKKRSWRIKLPASEQPKQQLTRKQIEERLGYEIEIIQE